VQIRQANWEAVRAHGRTSKILAVTVEILGLITGVEPLCLQGKSPTFFFKT